MSIPSTSSSGSTGASMGNSMNMFQSGAAGLSAQGTQAAGQDGSAMMDQIQQTAAMQMQFQTQMGIIQMIVKMNEALAKLFKAIGEAIKGLA
ncbi:hypothetical protein CS062_22755 [Roseateles chitinivorans]|uniref:Uncharacterized protein n=1 Tax=Roseateles chitinivorans TaxID=2917965 RepID=A0A2G9C5Q6_9BURK|nr:hypothetical protein [Roseateles chitinivorans]PIM50879.1 hypothetical protein CS062_22755 [Roseateles chitinivorans]